MKLVNQKETIVLKNGKVVTNNITGIDISMNTHLKTVKMTLKRHDPILLEHLTIRRKNKKIKKNQ